jgi:uncharacterized protein YndB with AHSA1/START domain
MLKTIAFAVAVIVAATLIYAATKPDNFTLSRSATIAAPPEKVFTLISDLKSFNTWNPFAKQDPRVKIDYEGAARGVGASYAWQGDASGAGRMAITEEIAPSKVVMRLDFDKPMKATNRVEFTLLPKGGSTEVTWTMSGSMTYLHKLMTTFVSMDKMVGSQFEAGLAELKAASERG